MTHRQARILRESMLHVVIGAFALLTLVPFAFALNNSFRTNTEMYHSFFGLPESVKGALRSVTTMAQGGGPLDVLKADGEVTQMPAGEALREYLAVATYGYRLSWTVLRRYMLNTLLVCSVTAAGVVLLGSVSAYILSRYRFPGSRAIFYYIIGTMMFPGVLTLVPSFLLVKELGLLNTHLALILPYIAGGQVFAIFVFKGFFEGLPEDLFEAARIDGAGHTQVYLNVVVPLSKPVIAVVMIMNIMGTWNNFMWPFITNTDDRMHVMGSGLYVLATSAFAQNFSTVFAAYMVSSIPLLLLFTYATRPFIQGITSGAFKA